MRSTQRRPWMMLIGSIPVAAVMVAAVSLADEADEAACAQRESGDPCQLSDGAIGSCQPDDVDEGALECDPERLSELSSAQP